MEENIFKSPESNISQKSLDLKTVKKGSEIIIKTDKDQIFTFRVFKETSENNPILGELVNNNTGCIAKSVSILGSFENEESNTKMHSIDQGSGIRLEMPECEFNKFTHRENDDSVKIERVFLKAIKDFEVIPVDEEITPEAITGENN